MSFYFSDSEPEEKAVEATWSRQMLKPDNPCPFEFSTCNQFATKNGEIYLFGESKIKDKPCTTVWVIDASLIHLEFTLII